MAPTPIQDRTRGPRTRRSRECLPPRSPSGSHFLDQDLTTLNRELGAAGQAADRRPMTRGADRANARGDGADDNGGTPDDSDARSILRAFADDTLRGGTHAGVARRPAGVSGNGGRSEPLRGACTGAASDLIAAAACSR